MVEQDSRADRRKVTHKITVTVKEVNGICTAGFKPGHRIVLKIPRVVLAETDTICVNAMSALMPYLRQFSNEPLPPNARSYVCCPDPGPLRGGRGNVLFEISHERIGT